MTVLFIIIIALTIIPPIIWNNKYIGRIVLINIGLWAAIELYSEFSTPSPDADAIFVIAVLLKSLIIGVISYTFMLGVSYISGKFRQQV